MKNSVIYLFINAIVLLAINTGCEELVSPLDGVAEADLFVQFGANTPDTVETAEGGSQLITIQSPISFGEDLVAVISFSGTAVFGTDFDLTAVDVESGNTGEDVSPIISSDATGAQILIPYIPVGGVDLITDQVSFTVNFLSDGVIDGEKILEITLDGAEGTISSDINLAGGRGSIQNDTYIIIEDEDGGD